jgi:hypothetical protein
LYFFRETGHFRRNIIISIGIIIRICSQVNKSVIGNSSHKISVRSDGQEERRWRGNGEVVERRIRGRTKRATRDAVGLAEGWSPACIYYAGEEGQRRRRKSIRSMRKTGIEVERRQRRAGGWAGEEGDAPHSKKRIMRRAKV